MVSYNAGNRARREAGTFHSPALAAKWVQETSEKNAGNPNGTEIRQFPNRLAAETYAKAWLRGN
jgi:hypothetical protein